MEGTQTVEVTGDFFRTRLVRKITDLGKRPTEAQLQEVIREAMLAARQTNGVRTGSEFSRLEEEVLREVVGLLHRTRRSEDFSSVFGRAAALLEALFGFEDAVAIEQIRQSMQGGTE